MNLELGKNHEYHFTVAEINSKFKTHNVSDNYPDSEVDSDIEKFGNDKKMPIFFLMGDTLSSQKMNPSYHYVNQLL